MAHPNRHTEKGLTIMGGKHEDPDSPKAKDMDGTEGGTGSTNDQNREAEGDHAKGKGKKK